MSFLFYWDLSILRFLVSIAILTLKKQDVKKWKLTQQQQHQYQRHTYTARNGYIWSFVWCFSLTGTREYVSNCCFFFGFVMWIFFLFSWYAFDVTRFFNYVLAVQLFEAFWRDNLVGERFYLPQLIFSNLYGDIYNVLHPFSPESIYVDPTKDYFLDVTTALAQLNVILDGYRRNSKCSSVHIVVQII